MQLRCEAGRQVQGLVDGATTEAWPLSAHCARIPRLPRALSWPILEGPLVFSASACKMAGRGAVWGLAWLSCIIFSWSASSVTQPLYLSCTVMTATPVNLWMLSNSGWVRHA